MLYRLHKFDAVPEGVLDVDTVVAFERLVVSHRHLVNSKDVDEFAQPRDDERRVGLLRRSERLLDTEVDLDRAVFEPATTSRG